MYKILFLIIFYVLFTGHKGINAVGVYTITPDGKFSEIVWQKAKKIVVDDSLTIYLLQTEKEICIGILLNVEDARYTDMYLKNGNVLYNLHASFQTGERLLPDSGFTDEEPGWHWGNNKMWNANTVAYTPSANEKLPFKQQLLPYEGYEFVISKEWAQAGKIKFMLELKGFAEGVAPILFPAKANKFNQSEWKEISDRQ